MFRNLFFLGLTAGVFSSIISFTYAILFTKIADFTEHTGFLKLLAFSLFITVGISMMQAFFNQIMKNKTLSSFLTHILLSGLTFVFVFFVFEMDEPVFKNEDSQMMIEYYKGFLIPIIFTPSLSWFSFKPIFIKS